MRNKRYNKTVKTDRSPSKQFQLRSTYPVRNRNSGGITPQQKMNHFHATGTCSIVDGNLTILLRGWNDKGMAWSDTSNKRYNKADKTYRPYSKQNQLMSTYLALNRNSGRITLQEQTYRFHITIPYSKVDGKVTTLLRGRNKKSERHKTNDITRPWRLTVRNNINSDQLTLISTETEEGSHSNNKRTTSTWPSIAA